jgi:hypothetical protein
MRARNAKARVGSIKVLWLATTACIAGFATTMPIAAQPPEQPRTTEAPSITVDELLRLLGEKPQISLHFKDAPPQQVLEELSRQTGFTFRLTEFGRDQDAKPVTVDVEGKEFWPVLNELSKQMGVSFRRGGLNQGFQVWPGRTVIERGNGPQSASLLGVLRADSVGRSRSLRWGADGVAGSTETVSVGLLFQIDPRIQVLSASYQPKIDEAVDNTGRSIALPRPAFAADFTMMGGADFDDGGGRRFNVSLRAPGPQAQRITRLKGSVRLRVATRSETWEVDVDEEKPRTKTIQRDGGQLSLNAGPWRRRGGAYEIELAMRELEAAPGVAGINRRRMLGFPTFGTVRLLDAQNRELNRGGSSGSGGSTGLEYRMSFSSRGGENDAGAPAKLVWTLPTEWKDVEVPFELTDLPLP